MHPLALIGTALSNVLVLMALNLWMKALHCVLTLPKVGGCE